MKSLLQHILTTVRQSWAERPFVALELGQRTTIDQPGGPVACMVRSTQGHPLSLLTDRKLRRRAAIVMRFVVEDQTTEVTASVQSCEPGGTGIAAFVVAANIVAVQVSIPAVPPATGRMPANSPRRAAA